jgi:hypothetical protein
MKEFIEKISSYNLFNYLLPGTVFVYLLSKLTSIDILQANLFIAAFLYYFIGLIISRIGSVLIEPILKKLKFLNFADYADFVVFSQKDIKLEILSESNNMYRTIVALFISLLILKLYDWMKSIWNLANEFGIVLLVILLLGLFLFSYRKQTNYITKRINAYKKTGTQLV